MKKLILSVFAIAFLATVSNAQLAIRGGVNLANLTAEQDGTTLEYDSKIGFQFGVTYSASINENLAFRPGLLYSMKGAQFEILDEKSKLKFDYLEIPLDFVYKAGMIDINAGPYVGLLMSAKVGDEDVKDDVNGMDFGLNVGAMYNINMNLGLGVNYGLGLANLVKDAPDNTSTKVKNLAIYVAYKL